MSTVLTGCIGIFWDYENCRPPSNISGAKLVENICRLVRGAGAITQFKAYVDVSSEVAQPRSIAFHSDLQSSGVTLAHCPHIHNGKKDVADKMMIVDMLAFALDRPPPAKIVIITGDRDFAYATATLRLRGYETIIISPPNMSQTILKMQADHLFDWKKDVIDATSPDTSAVVVAVSQPMVVIAAEDHRPKVSGTPETCLTAENPETGACLSKPVLDDTVKSRIAVPMDSTVDAKPSTKETTPTFLKSLSTFFSGAPKSSQAPSFKSEASPSPVQPVTCSGEVSNKPGCALSSPLKAQGAGLSVDAVSNCGCAICTRSGRVKQALSGSTVPAVKQSAAYCPEQHYNSHNRSEDTVNSSTNTPTSVSTVTSSSNTTHSTTSSFANKEPSVTTPSPASILRFRPLINYFIEQRTLARPTRLRSSTIASELLKRDSTVYKTAGVDRMKQYVKEARDAAIIISPGLDKEGDGWVEINPSLYPEVKLTSTHKGSQLNGISKIYSTNMGPFKPPKPVVDAAFEPLVARLRKEAPGYTLPRKELRKYFTTKHPLICQIAGVKNFSKYLEKVVGKGIICLEDRAGGQLVKLTEKYRPVGR